jgi:ribosome-binding factor A
MAQHGFKRAQRVAEEVRKAISELLVEGSLRDPRLAMTTITEVEITDDLRYAKVYFSVLGDETVQTDAQKSFNRAAGFIKTEIGRRLRLRYTPEMKFFFDPSMERAARISQLLGKISPAPEPADEDGADDD